MSQAEQNDADNNLDDNVNSSLNNTFDNDDSLAVLDISAADSIHDDILESFYNRENLLKVMMATLDNIDERIKNGLTLPYYADIDTEVWQEKSKALDIYIKNI